MNPAHKLKSRGFTLIELLVVISIIGLLSSIVLASLNTARIKARNAERISEIDQLRTAFNLALGSGSYPNSSYAYPCLTVSCFGGWSGYVADATVSSYLAPYISKPTDPSDNTRGYGGFLYLTPNNWSGDLSDGFPSGYYIWYTLEPGASNCGPGVIQNTLSNYISCLLSL